MSRASVLGMALVSLLLVTTVQATFIDGFEDGTMNNWTVIPGTGRVNLTVQNSASSGTVLPHSGSYLAYQERYYGTYPGVRHSLPAASTGTATFWVNPIVFNGTYVFDVCVYGGHGETLRLTSWDLSGTAIRLYKPGGTYINTGVAITAKTWHEAKFVIRDASLGSQVYWDGALIADGITGIFDAYTLEMGTNWGSASVAYDDVSFVEVPEPATVILLAMGVIGLIRRK